MKERIIYQIATILDKECNVATKEYHNQYPDTHVVFGVYQMRNELISLITPLDIANFYNTNWVGNVDFVHIPDCTKIIKDMNEYPLIVAYDLITKEVLGAATVRYCEVTDENVNPFFPERNSKQIEITGILTNVRNKEYGCYGIGKKINEIAITAVHDYKIYQKDVRLTCEVDCRNVKSINAIYAAVKNVERKFIVNDPTLCFPTPVVGYYYTVKPNGDLYESTILVMEVKFDASKKLKVQAPLIEYNIDESIVSDANSLTREDYVTKVINPALLKAIRGVAIPNYNQTVIKNVAHDLDGSAVYYNMLDHDANPLERFLNIDPKETTFGKDRRPYDAALLKQQYDEYFGTIGVSEFTPNSQIVKKIGWRKTR